MSVRSVSITSASPWAKGRIVGTAWLANSTYSKIIKVNLADGSISNFANVPSCWGMAYHNRRLYVTQLSQRVSVLDAVSGNLTNQWTDSSGGDYLGIAWDPSANQLVLTGYGTGRVTALSTNGVFTQITNNLPGSRLPFVPTNHQDSS